MKTKRSLAAALALAAVLCLALAGCVRTANQTQAALYPDDKLIAQQSDTYTAVLWSGFLPGKVDMGRFSGTAAFLRITVPEGGGQLAIDYDQTVTAGAFKTVLVKYGERVDVICEGTAEGERTFDLEAGDYAVKAVGLDAACSISAQIGATDGVEAIMPGDVFDEDVPVALEPLVV